MGIFSVYCFSTWKYNSKTIHQICTSWILVAYIDMDIRKHCWLKNKCTTPLGKKFPAVPVDLLRTQWDSFQNSSWGLLQRVRRGQDIGILQQKPGSWTSSCHCWQKKTRHHKSVDQELWYMERSNQFINHSSYLNFLGPGPAFQSRIPQCIQVASALLATWPQHLLLDMAGDLLLSPSQ